MKNKFLSTFKGKKVFITGTTGFKGSWLSIWLESIGAEVYGYALKPISKDDNFVVSKIDQKISQKYDDICNYNELQSAIEDIQPEFNLDGELLFKSSKGLESRMYEIYHLNPGVTDPAKISTEQEYHGYPGPSPSGCGGRSLSRGPLWGA